MKGAYRKPGQGLGKEFTEPSKRMKYNPGARGVQLLAEVGNNKVLVWKYIEGRNWSGQVAEEMYKTVIAKKLQSEFPGCRSWNVLEDNDASGFKSG